MTYTEAKKFLDYAETKGIDEAANEGYLDDIKDDKIWSAVAAYKAARCTLDDLHAVAEEIVYGCDEEDELLDGEDDFEDVDPNLDDYELGILPCQLDVAGKISKGKGWQDSARYGGGPDYSEVASLDPSPSIFYGTVLG